MRVLPYLATIKISISNWLVICFHIGGSFAYRYFLALARDLACNTSAMMMITPIITAGEGSVTRIPTDTTLLLTEEVAVPFALTVINRRFVRIDIPAEHVLRPLLIFRIHKHLVSISFIIETLSHSHCGMHRHARLSETTRYRIVFHNVILIVAILMNTIFSRHEKASVLPRRSRHVHFVSLPLLLLLGGMMR